MCVRERSHCETPCLSPTCTLGRTLRCGEIPRGDTMRRYRGQGPLRLVIQVVKASTAGESLSRWSSLYGWSMPLQVVGLCSWSKPLLLFIVSQGVGQASAAGQCLEASSATRDCTPLPHPLPHPSPRPSVPPLTCPICPTLHLTCPICPTPPRPLCPGSGA